MKEQQLELLLRNHDYSADALRIKVGSLLLGFCIVSSLIFMVSYVITGQYALIPYVLLPFALPCAAFYYLLRETRSYKIIVIVLIYIYSVLGLMHLSAVPDYLVDLFLMPVFIGSAFLMLKYRHAVLMVGYLLLIYVLTSAIVYYYQPFDVIYTNDNTSSIAVGFLLSISISATMYYFFAKNYQINSDLLSDMVLTLSKTNDDNKLLLGVISHDFRNYLMRVLLSIEEGKTSSIDERQLQVLESVEASIHELSKLLSEVQHVRELFHNDDMDMLEDTAFPEIIKKLELTFRLQMQQKNLAFDMCADDGVMLKINRDVFIHIILANLIGNAIKFSPRGERIQVKLEKDTRGKRLTISNLAAKEQLDNLRKIASGNERIVSLPGTLAEKGQGMGVSITKRFCKSCEITYSLSVVPAHASDLWLVNTTLAFA